MLYLPQNSLHMHSNLQHHRKVQGVAVAARMANTPLFTHSRCSAFWLQTLHTFNTPAATLLLHEDAWLVSKTATLKHAAQSYRLRACNTGPCGQTPNPQHTDTGTHTLDTNNRPVQHTIELLHYVQHTHLFGHAHSLTAHNSTLKTCLQACMANVIAAVSHGTSLHPTTPDTWLIQPAHSPTHC